MIFTEKSFSGHNFKLQKTKMILKSTEHSNACHEKLDIFVVESGQ